MNIPVLGFIALSTIGLLTCLFWINITFGQYGIAQSTSTLKQLVWDVPFQNMSHSKTALAYSRHLINIDSCWNTSQLDFSVLFWNDSPP